MYDVGLSGKMIRRRSNDVYRCTTVPCSPFWRGAVEERQEGRQTDSEAGPTI